MIDALPPHPPAIVEQSRDEVFDAGLRGLGYPRYCRRAVIAELRRVAGGTRADVDRVVRDVTWHWSQFNWSPVLGAGMMINPYVYAADTGYQITRSLRFNSADSAYLNRTPGVAGDQKTATVSCWVKRGKLGVTSAIFSIGAGGGNQAAVFFNSSDKLEFMSFNVGGASYFFRLITTQVFRDTTAWYHILCYLDAANTTARIYVNGVQVTALDTNTQPSNVNNAFGGTNVYSVGRNYNSSDYFDGLLAEFHYVNGAALTPSSFTESDATTGALVAKAYAGSYGTGGCWLSFANNASTTTIGYDDAGGAAGFGAGSNDWTANNFSVAAGAGSDSLVDTPTNYGTDTGAGGEVRGNYATLTPLDKAASTSLSNGNLEGTTGSSTYYYGMKASIGASSGKWYWEVGFTGSLTGHSVGIISSAAAAMADSDTNYNSANVYLYISTANKRNNNSSSSYGATYSNANVIGVALDMDAGTLTFYKDGVSQGTSYTGLSGTFFPAAFTYSSVAMLFNFGQRPFAYAAPSGYKALCTQNLPVPTIKKSSDYFDVNLRAGTGSAGSVTGKGFQPDLVWCKSRSSRSHMVADSVRGTGKYWSTDSTADETSDAQSVTAFNSDGFSFGTAGILNTNAENFVDWLWKKGATPGVDVVTYTGNGSNRTVSHAVGVAPEFVIVKARATAGTDIAAQVWHSAIANTEYLVMNTTAAKASGATRWNSTSPTSSVFSLGTSDETNKNSDTFVAYLFASVRGFSKVGTFIGNGAADGQFAYCGFKPRWILIKRVDSTGDWYMWDTKRETYNPLAKQLLADTNAAEGSTEDIDVVSNGFKLRTTTADINASTGVYAFVAFAEVPFKYARAA